MPCSILVFGRPPEYSRQWQMHWSGAPWQNGVVGIDHYLDGFVVVVPPGPGVSGSIRGGMYSVGGDLGSREEGRAENQIDIPGYRGGHCSWLFVPPGR